jgi:hypothetical protein
MARADHKVTSKGFRDTAAAVTAGAIILIFLFLPTEVFSEYHIIANGNQITTLCYWVQGSRVFLYEDGKPLPLSQVSSIKEGSFSPLEIEMHEEAERRFFTYLTWMTDREVELVNRAKDNLDLLETIEDLRTNPKQQPEFRRLTKKSLSEIRDLKNEANDLLRSWTKVRVPDRSLLILSEIESSQILTVHMSLEERRIYLTSWDPTYLEYTFEHMEQVLTFDQSFSQAYKKGYGKPKINE